MKKILILVMLLIVVLFVFVTALSFAEDFDYRKAMLKQYEVGTILTIRAMIFQIGSSGEGTATLVDSTLIYIFEWKDATNATLVAVFSKNPFALKGDIVEFQAKYLGIVTYKTAFGLNTVPAVKFIQLNKNGK